ncbi:uncharacterized protein LOC122029279 [Zingiber officinale]|uniref:uncharacterized protein LOC122029279 n=1 Tax=Zingiber officinale TaxID=94328 RepID=UPI001C4CA86E|nr:uncharacterized protein LOC122029279 [Zingiber officinale]
MPRCQPTRPGSISKPQPTTPASRPISTSIPGPQLPSDPVVSPKARARVEQGKAPIVTEQPYAPVAPATSNAPPGPSSFPEVPPTPASQDTPATQAGFSSIRPSSSTHLDPSEIAIGSSTHPPSGEIAVGPSQSQRSHYRHYRATKPSEWGMRGPSNAQTSHLTPRGQLSTDWEESLRRMHALPMLTQLDRFSEGSTASFSLLYQQNKALTDTMADLESKLSDPASGVSQLRAEVSTLKKVNATHEQTLGEAQLEIDRLREEKSRLEALLKSSENKCQEAQSKLAQCTTTLEDLRFAHKKETDRKAQELSSRDLLIMDQRRDLESQATRLGSLQAELSQAQSALSNSVIALETYKAGEHDRLQASLEEYLRSPDFGA